MADPPTTGLVLTAGGARGAYQAGALELLPALALRGLSGWRHAGGQATYPAWRPRLQMHHVLLRGPLTVAGARVHPVTTSDHLPLVVDLEPRPAP